MDVDTPLRLYCERLEAGWFAEPLNAVSNLAFLYWAWKLWARSGREGRPARLAQRILAADMVLVGIGSLAFHTFATAWARILDLAFIGVFNLAFLAVFLRLVAGWSGLRVLAALVAFIAVDRLAAISGVAMLMNGSGTYLPALLTLALLTAYACRISPPAARLMGSAALVFLVSITARTADQAVCPHWPWGTHFLWHLLNAWVLYQLSRAIRP